MEPLEFYACIEAKGWDCAADDAILLLEADGLVTVEGTGWGMRKVRLTAKGRSVLSATFTQVDQPGEPIPDQNASPQTMKALTDAADFEGRVQESCDVCGGEGWLGEISHIPELDDNIERCPACHGTGVMPDGTDQRKDPP